MTALYFQEYAFISLGANLDSSLGGPEVTIKHAITLLREFSSLPLLVSSLYKTSPLDCPPGSPIFVNGVIGLCPLANETAFSLLSRLQGIENKLGRTRSGTVNEARVLDLDLITFKYEDYQTDELTLPHPRAAQRRFVLQPLRELVGNVAFPGIDASIDELIARQPE